MSPPRSKREMRGVMKQTAICTDRICITKAAVSTYGYMGYGYRWMDIWVWVWVWVWV
jgi:hypothetical protein